MASTGPLFSGDDAGCTHCPDGHDDPLRRRWAVYLDPTPDGDGQPVTLHVCPSNGAHVAESDAVWLRKLINDSPSGRSAPGLPPFSGDDPKCPKCSHYDATTTHVPTGARTPEGCTGECLQRECDRCGYAWAEATVEVSQ